jgi:hypothetical protein
MKAVEPSAEGAATTPAPPPPEAAQPPEVQRGASKVPVRQALRKGLAGWEEIDDGRAEAKQIIEKIKKETLISSIRALRGSSKLPLRSSARRRWIYRKAAVLEFTKAKPAAPLGSAEGAPMAAIVSPVSVCVLGVPRIGVTMPLGSSQTGLYDFPMACRPAF